MQNYKINQDIFFPLTWQTESKFCGCWLWTDSRVNYFLGANATMLHKVLEVTLTKCFCTDYPVLQHDRCS